MQPICLAIKIIWVPEIVFVPVFSEKFPASRTPQANWSQEKKRESGFVLFDCEVARVLEESVEGEEEDEGFGGGQYRRSLQARRRCGGRSLKGCGSVFWWNISMFPHPTTPSSFWVLSTISRSFSRALCVPSHTFPSRCTSLSSCWPWRFLDSLRRSIASPCTFETLCF